jgi:hypothetical protein
MTPAVRSENIFFPHTPYLYSGIPIFGKSKITVMKRVFLLIAFLACFQLAGFSQKSRVGASGGVTVASMSTTLAGEKETNSSNLGVIFSMWIDVPVTGNIVFRPNLSYVQKGKKRETGSGSTAQTIWDELRYGEFCGNFVYNVAGGTGNFFIGLGPSVSVGLPSKRVTKTVSSKGYSDIVFGKTVAEHYRNFDFGVNGLAGFELPAGWFIAVNYNHGIRNLITGDQDGTIRNSYFGVQLGMMFKNK